MIEGYQQFNYLGYTLGDALPTLYFFEGHYTQSHGNPRNVGWHPRTVFYRGANVSRRTLQAMKVVDETFRTQFFQGQLDAKNNASADVVFFESFGPNNSQWGFHQSRGKFFSVHDPDFDQNFNRDYAMGVLERGELSAYDKPSFIPEWGELEYVGYVPHDTTPALIYKEGFYLPRHKEEDWIGWHPAQAVYHFGNVNDEYEMEGNLPDTLDISDKLKGVLLFPEEASDHESSSGFDHPLVIYNAAGKKSSTAIFLDGCLVEPVEPTFEARYNADYGATILSQAKFAPVCDPDRMPMHLFALTSGHWRASSFVSMIQAAAAHGHTDKLLQAGKHATLFSVVSEFLANNLAMENEILTFNKKLDEARSVYRGGWAPDFKGTMKLLEHDYNFRCHCMLTLPPEAMMVLAKQFGMSVKITTLEGNNCALTTANLSGKNVIYGLGKTGQQPGLFNGLMAWKYIDPQELVYHAGDMMLLEGAITSLSQLYNKICYRVEFY